MKRDQRREEDLSSVDVSSWPNQLTYLSNLDTSASYSESPNFLGPYEPHYVSDSHGYPISSTHDTTGLTNSTPLASNWSDIPLDPNAIYHVRSYSHWTRRFLLRHLRVQMPSHPPGWPDLANPESPYERDRLLLRQVWQQTVRDQWLRRNGINALSTDTQYDRFIPELRAGEYTDRYLGGADAQSGPAGNRTEEM